MTLQPLPRTRPKGAVTAAPGATSPAQAAAPANAPPGALSGLPASVPPADVPLGFLAASGIGLIAVGVATVLVAHGLVDAPIANRPLAAVHLTMLAFLTTGVLGAFHQFAPVAGRRPLRSVAAARLTLGLVVVGAWGLPIGFATGSNPAVAAAGVALTTSFCLAAWNLSGPLLGPGHGPSIVGLRLSLAGLLATAGFGVTYAFDRQVGERWFLLTSHLVLAHAHLGLLAWLGVTYVAVAEKLWPMFLLAHRPGRSPGEFAVWLIPAGVVLVVAGLMATMRPVVAVGGVVVAGGLGCHLASFSGLVRHRHRPLELLHAFVATSAVFLLLACAFAAVAGFAPVDTLTRMRLVSAEIASLAAWLGLALIGHAHKVVPFIAWTRLRARGVTTTPDGRPLLFGHLWNGRVGWATYGAATAGFASAVAGLAAGSAPFLVVAGALLGLGGLMVTANLAWGPVAVAGPAVAGPAVAGPAVAGPAVAGPAVAGPAVAGPAVGGPAVAGPAKPHRTDSTRRSSRNARETTQEKDKVR